jgi:hypothetical protein
LICDVVPPANTAGGGATPGETRCEVSSLPLVV